MWEIIEFGETFTQFVIVEFVPVLIPILSEYWIPGNVPFSLIKSAMIYSWRKEWRQNLWKMVVYCPQILTNSGSTSKLYSIFFPSFAFIRFFSLLPRLQVMKTEFVPKLVATATACCAIYLVLRVSAHLLTVKTLASVGYFDTLVSVNLTPVSSSHLSSANRALTQRALSLPGQFFITDFISGLVHRPQI